MSIFGNIFFHIIYELYLKQYVLLERLGVNAENVVVVIVKTRHVTMSLECVQVAVRMDMLEHSVIIVRSNDLLKYFNFMTSAIILDYKIVLKKESFYFHIFFII